MSLSQGQTRVPWVDRIRHDRVVAGLIALAILLRVPRLLESLWYDEISAWFQFGAHGPAVILGRYFDPANHIAHTLASWCSVVVLERVMGFELALRFPALLASVLLVPVVYGLLRSACGGRAGLIAAAIAAAAPVAVLEGAEARGYSMMMLFAAAATATLIAALRAGGWRWPAYALLLALGAWTHPITALVGVGHGMWLAASARKDRRRSLLGAAAMLAGALLTVALYAPVVRELLGLRAGLAATSADQPRLLGAEGAHLVWQMGGSWSWWAAAPGLTAAAIGLACGFGTPERRRLIVMTLSGLAGYAAIVLASGVWSYARFGLFAWPGAVVLIAAGIDALWRRRPAAAIGLGVLIAAAWSADLLTRPPKQPLRDAALHVMEHGGPGARVLVVGLAHRVFAIYAAQLDLTFSLRHGQDIEAALAESHAEWIVVYYPRNVSTRTLGAIQAAGFVESRRFAGWVDWGNGDVVVFGKRGTEGLRD